LRPRRAPRAGRCPFPGGRGGSAGRAARGRPQVVW
jgi:hypothetical protein